MSLAEILAKYKNKGALIDSNLLLLYFVCKYEPNLISSYKRTKIYTLQDYRLIDNIVSYFSKIVTTPNILTEVSNLSTQLPDSKRYDYFREFRNQVSLITESYVASSRACSNDYFSSIGLTDSAIVELAKNNYLVFTDDFRLVGLLRKTGVDAVNINHLRSLEWFGM